MSATVRKNVLVVDDDLCNCRLLETVLAREGYTVRSCDSGGAALAAVAEQLPDIILLDVMMPGMDGFEVVRRLKTDPVTAGVPVVMVTALEDEASRQRLARAGIDEVVNKPIDRWQLKAKLAALFEVGGGKHA